MYTKLLRNSKGKIRWQVVAVASAGGIAILVFAGALLVLAPQAAYANNVVVENVALVDKDITNDTYDVQFDIAWDNSWFIAGAPSATANWDAAWVFAKFSSSTDGGTTWSDWVHCTLLNTGNVAPTGSQMAFGDTGGVYKGIFIYRNAAGTGSVDYNDAELRWAYGTDGVTDTAAVKLKVFAVEMVYIPTGAFDIGDGNGTTESTSAFHVTDNTKAGTIGATLLGSVKVDVNGYDDDVIEGTSPSNGIGIDGDGGIDYSSPQDGVIDNANFPTGYNAFYIMKYEVSQGQYRDFLNMLTRAQQNTRTETNVSTDAITNVFVMSNSAVISFRSGIACPASGNGTTAAITFGVDGEATPDSVFNESNDGEWRAANYLSWMDLAAYADWAALRPMTELEYEKASRGPTAAVSGEYAWGSTTIDYFSDLLNDGTSSEAKGSTRPNANCNYSSATPDGPIRCGMFATSSSTRELAGVSYYGVMELSGNVWERCVTVGNSTGRNFTGTHGDGVLTTALTYEGNATNSDWPGMDGTTSRGVTGATGSGFRGGNWYLGGATSDRSSAAVTDTTRSSFYGARAVRTSP